MSHSPESSPSDKQDFHPLYLAIGRFQVNWSMFEYELYRFTKIIYANCSDFTSPKFPDGIAGKIALLTQVLKKEPRLSEVSADGLKLTESFWRHRDLRNLLVHGSLVSIKNSSTLIFLVPPQIGEGPLKRAREEEVELSRIEVEGQEMEDGALEFGGFIAEFESALPIPPGSHP